ncbi:MAG: ketoacyl-ACP synthase III [Desulfobacteraceae bacterium]|nr:ketoacyl-ACP synthase III [Desulfobacteraceae bacterium]
MNLKLENVTIRHINATVPSNTVDNLSLDFEENLKKKVIKNTGIKERRVIPDGTSLMELYIPCANETLEKTGWDIESIDGVIAVSQTHEYKLPASACIIHEKLGLKLDAFAYDITMGCSGYLYGLFSAVSSITVSRGSIKRVLLFVGDAPSTFCHPKNQSTIFLFGDAVSCTALEYDPQAGESFFVLKSDGRGYRHLIVEHGGLKHPIDESSYADIVDKDGNVTNKASVYMNGLEIFNFTIAQVPPLIDELSHISGTDKDKMEVFCLHQANKFILDYLAKKMKVKDRTPINLEKFGNTSCASIPLVIADRPDECLVRNAVLCGFGVGWSMAACLVNLEQTTASLSEV